MKKFTAALAFILCILLVGCAGLSSPTDAPNRAWSPMLGVWSGTVQCYRAGSTEPYETNSYSVEIGGTAERPSIRAWAPNLNAMLPDVSASSPTRIVSANPNCRMTFIYTGGIITVQSTFEGGSAFAVLNRER